MGTDVVKNVNKNNASHAVLFEALALVSSETCLLILLYLLLLIYLFLNVNSDVCMFIWLAAFRLRLNIL